VRILTVALTNETYPKFHHRWVDALVEAGHDVHWASQDWGEADRLRRADVNFHEAAIPRGIDPLGSLRAAVELRGLHEEIQPDIVVSEQTVAGFLARMAAPVGSFARRVHIVHSWPWDDRSSALKRAIGSRAEKLAAWRTDHFVVINEEDTREGRRLGILPEGGTTTQAVGIDPDLYSKMPSENRIDRAAEEAGLTGDESFVFLFVGRMVEYKGIFDLLDAFHRVLESAADDRLVMVGQPDEYPASRQAYRRLRRRVETEEVDDRVHLVEYVEDLPALHARADAFVMPSTYEGLGLVYLEAGAMGVPSIGYDVRGVREAIDHGRTGLLVQPGDINGLSEAMLRLVRDPNLRRRLGEAGRDRWRHGYDNREFAEAMTRVITEGRVESPGPGEEPS